MARVSGIPVVVLAACVCAFLPSASCAVVKKSESELSADMHSMQHMLVNGTIAIENAIEYELPQAGKPRNKVVLAILVGIPLLGQLGCDRCFLGNVMFGCLKGVTCGCCGIWTAFDFVILAYNLLTLAPGINTMGMKAVFAKDSISTARMVFVGVWLVCVCGGVCVQIVMGCATVAAGGLATENKMTGMTTGSYGNSLGIDRFMVKTIFTNADKDNSGDLDSEEMLELLSSKMGYNKEMCEAMIKDIDANKDGKITIEEFMAAFDDGKLNTSDLSGKVEA